MPVSLAEHLVLTVAELSLIELTSDIVAVSLE